MRHRAAAHVFVDDIGAPELAADDAHHLARVLRLRPGEEVTIADGHGGWRRCAFAGGAHLEPLGDVEHVERPEVAVTVAFALTKGDKPELAVQKLTEMGIDRIVPITAARSVVVWDGDKAARNVARLRAVARAAAMQSRRAFLPVVEDVATLQAIAGDGVALAHADGGPLDETLTTIAVARHVDLGPTTLRAETAALVAGVLLTGLRDGRIGSGSGG
jgi:16S rRNA (uracil1498-N3)-methyltransferase